MIVNFKKLDPRAVIPDYKTEGSAGADLCALVETFKSRRMYSGQIYIVGTGLSIELPEGYEAQVRPRSGLACKYGITVINAPGTIDSDYRGEIKVALVHLGDEPHDIITGDRIAQLVISPVTRATFVEVAETGATERGSGGFGSTGYST